MTEALLKRNSLQHWCFPLNIAKYCKWLLLDFKGTFSKSVLYRTLKIYRRTPMQKCISKNLQSNFIEITLRHGFSPVNLVPIFRTFFYKNTSEWLLPNFQRHKGKKSCSEKKVGLISLCILSFYCLRTIVSLKNGLVFLDT